MSNTESAEFRFEVKESGSGEPWIMLEATKGDITALEGGFLGLKLSPGTTYEEAKLLARTLESGISAVSYTRL